MSILYFNITITILWLLSALADYGQFCYVWQFKEYRFDRLRDYGSTVSGKKFFHGWRVLKRPIIYLVLFLLLPENLKSLAGALIAVFSVDLAYNLWAIAGHNLPRPKLTAKAAFLIILSLSIEGALLFFLFNQTIIFVVLALRWFIFSSLAIAAKLPTGIAKLIYLKKAENKLLKFKKIIVIGVTGSYGKTTVKNFLAQVLGEKYKVIITPENINTEIGIARFIIKNNFSESDIFVVEMGTYKIGEIAAVCRMVKPKVGILTVISDQHLSLLGNIKNTQTAKYELLRSLPAAGLAITNSDNPYCREFLGELKCRVATFGARDEFNPDCLIKNITAGETRIEFVASIKKNGQLNISAPVLGSHNSLNIAPVILVGLFLGLSEDEIISRSNQLKLPLKVLQTYAYGQSLILDDSYNANPDGFLAALDVLANCQERKKIVITRGMLELGSASQNWHETVGKRIGQVADELIIISPDYVSALTAGAEGFKIKIKNMFEAKNLFDYLRQIKSEPNIILLENRQPEIINREIKKVHSK